MLHSVLCEFTAGKGYRTVGIFLVLVSDTSNLPEIDDGNSIVHTYIKMLALIPCIHSERLEQRNTKSRTKCSPKGPKDPNVEYVGFLY